MISGFTFVEVRAAFNTEVYDLFFWASVVGVMTRAPVACFTIVGSDVVGCCGGCGGGSLLLSSVIIEVPRFWMPFATMFSTCCIIEVSVVSGEVMSRVCFGSRWRLVIMSDCCFCRSLICWFWWSICLCRDAKCSANSVSRSAGRVLSWL